MDEMGYGWDGNSIFLYPYGDSVTYLVDFSFEDNSAIFVSQLVDFFLKIYEIMENRFFMNYFLLYVVFS